MWQDKSANIGGEIMYRFTSQTHQSLLDESRTQMLIGLEVVIWWVRRKLQTSWTAWAVVAPWLERVNSERIRRRDSKERTNNTSSPNFSLSSRYFFTAKYADMIELNLIDFRRLLLLFDISQVLFWLYLFVQTQISLFYSILDRDMKLFLLRITVSHLEQ